MNMNKDASVKRETSLTESDGQPGFFGELWQQARLVFRLLRDPEVPIYVKVVPFLGLIYLVLPFDFLPDVIPGLGQLDDLTLILVGAKVFLELAPQDVVMRHIQQIRRRDGYADEAEESGESLLHEDAYARDADVIEGIIIEDEPFAPESKEGDGEQPAGV